jgi:hypothetical protein
MMAGSYERINYTLRPAKSVERKMIAEALRRLSHFQHLEQYHYVGMGSLYFADFRLFHEALGIQSLTSIERDEEHEERFRFNLPYSCIDLKLGQSNDILPALPEWDDRVIVWLDYDGRLDASVLADVDTVCARARSGSMVIVTCNSQPVQLDTREQELRERVGDKVPVGTTEASLANWGTARVHREILTGQIEATLRDRGDEFGYRQIFNFHYDDGAKMLTAGGVVFRTEDEAIVDACAFDDFDFVEQGQDPFNITAPRLTFREMQHFEAQLPAADLASIDTRGVPPADVDRFRQLYRHFPWFVDASM